MTQFTARIGISATDNTSRAFQSVAANAKGLRGVLGGIQRVSDRVASRAAAASAGAALAIAAGARQLISNESALAGTVKTFGYEGAIAIQRQLQGEIGKTGLGLEALNGIASQLSVSGITDRGELVAITATSAEAAKAFDISGEAAADSLATFRGAFRANSDEIKRYADNLNYLADGSNAKAGDILAANRQLSPLAASSGISPEMMTSMSATALNAGFDPSVASTGLKNVAINLQAGTNATKAQIKAFNELGLTADDVSRSMTIDADKTILTVLGKIADADPGRRSALTTSLFGKESASVVALINDYDGLVARQQQLKNGAAAGSMDKEIANALSTKSAQITVAIEKLKAAGASAAGAFAPVISTLADLATRAADTFDGLSEGTKQWTAYSIAAVAAVAPLAYTVSAAAGAIRGLVAVTSLVVGPLARMAVAARGALVGLTMITTVAGGFSLAGMTAAFGTVGAAFAAAAWPVTLFIAAVTAVAYAAYKISQHWEPIKGFFSDLWGGFTGLVSDAWAAVSDFAANAGTALAGFASSALSAIGAAGYDLLTMIIPPETLDDVIAKALEIGTAISDTIRGAFTGLVDWVSGIFGSIFTGIKNEMTGFAQWLTSFLPDRFNPFNGVELPASPVAAPAPVAASASPSAAMTTPAAQQANAVTAQPTAETVTETPAAQAATAALGEIKLAVASLSAALDRGGQVNANVNVRVSGGGQVTGASATGTGLATAGNVGVQELD